MRGVLLPCHPMRRLVDIDLMDDEQLQAQMTANSLWILLSGVLLGVLAAVVLPHEEITLLWFALLVGASVVALPIHELVHALAFELLSGFRARISFGFKSGMLYTCAVGTVLPRGRFCAVLLAPAIVVTGALVAFAAALGMPLMGWFLSTIHLAGCTGDFGYVRIIASEPRANLVQDTKRGIALFHDE